MDAAVVTAAIINNLQSVVSREISPMDPAVVTVRDDPGGHPWNCSGGEQLYDRNHPLLQQ